MIISENGPQFILENFKELMSKWDVMHGASSPRYAQSNGEAERGVQIFKRLAEKNKDVNLALMCCRVSPF